MDLKLTGRVAVVTGASKGIGLAITRTLLLEGARVVAASRKSSPELDELAGEDLVHVAVDLMNPEAPEQIVAQAVESFGGLDILVNNAGGPPPGIKLPRSSFLEAGDADWQAMFEFNLFSPVRAIRAAIPRMLERGSGSIINISSGNGRQPSPINVDYGAAKAGINNITKVLTEEFGPQGIRINTVSPGGVRTAWWTEEGGAADIIAERAGADRDAVMDTLAPQMMNMVTGRLVDPQEIADVVALLASPRSASTTGADFVVDGGFLKSL
ncbi:SDR family NAD(P)-dependent oxidoreductase [Kibdelosporangium phytohabitans]|uniref:3-oxoacyl-ACP reductase n=1 Tax=Kibdelosporangium phytohabitans TaxID=860235 RepID=A0A0N9I1R1_9PSEU|nr:SDR family NAD(P)-dependent oxidoreductase [Kibdelosporangium phytohabitans]ALG09961.1 3-oxoacyl-ACP reductase [Kibdelosporangium phytohabitans]MBE1468625.1 NAD(P)-dependent dehydrogenase (short-subunit alcohol dehydrogenase family) [Kibdelosporangium phytohabitans]